MSEPDERLQSQMAFWIPVQDQTVQAVGQDRLDNPDVLKLVPPGPSVFRCQPERRLPPGQSVPIEFLPGKPGRSEGRRSAGADRERSLALCHEGLDLCGGAELEGQFRERASLVECRLSDSILHGEDLSRGDAERAQTEP